MPEIAPKKKFGQNFLTDQTVLERIIKSAGPLENKSILEIGGGSGNLTKHLLKAKPKKILVIEIDKDYIYQLENILKSEKDCVIDKVLIKPGDSVGADEELILFSK